MPRGKEVCHQGWLDRYDNTVAYADEVCYTVLCSSARPDWSARLQRGLNECRKEAGVGPAMYKKSRRNNFQMPVRHSSLSRPEVSVFLPALGESPSRIAELPFPRAVSSRHAREVQPGGHCSQGLFRLLVSSQSRSLSDTMFMSRTRKLGWQGRVSLCVLVLLPKLV